MSGFSTCYATNLNYPGQESRVIENGPHIFLPEFSDGFFICLHQDQYLVTGTVLTGINLTLVKSIPQILDTTLRTLFL